MPTNANSSDGDLSGQTVGRQADSKSGVDHAVLAQERKQTLDQFHRAKIVNRDPTRIVGVVPVTERSTNDSDRKVDDHEVILRGHTLHPSDDPIDDNVEPGLLGHLTSRRLDQGLAEFHPATRDRPLPHSRSPTPLDQKQFISSTGDRTNADLRAKRIAHLG